MNGYEELKKGNLILTFQPYDEGQDRIVNLPASGGLMEKITKENGWHIWHDFDECGRRVHATKRFGNISIDVSRHDNAWWATVGYCEPEFVHMIVSDASYRRVAELAEDLLVLCKKMINKKGE